MSSTPFASSPFVDDLSFEFSPIPEPGPSALLGLGLLGLGVARRARR